MIADFLGFVLQSTFEAIIDAIIKTISLVFNWRRRQTAFSDSFDPKMDATNFVEPYPFNPPADAFPTGDNEFKIGDGPRPPLH